MAVDDESHVPPGARVHRHASPCVRGWRAAHRRRRRHARERPRGIAHLSDRGRIRQRHREPDAGDDAVRARLRKPGRPDGYLDVHRARAVELLGSAESNGWLMQSSVAGDARAIAGVPTDEQSVDVRARRRRSRAPASATAGSARWRATSTTRTTITCRCAARTR